MTGIDTPDLETAGDATAPREMTHFVTMTPAAQLAAIRRMACSGWSIYGIAHATRLSAEQVQTALTGCEGDS